jgi:diacylglycerol kinase (ATP)
MAGAILVATAGESREEPVPSTVQRLMAATRHSWQGLVAAYRGEQAFREELLVTAILTPVASWVGESGAERGLLLGSLLLVLITELLNSALEAAVDRIGPEHHPLAGRAKDMGSAAVLVALILAGCIWFLVVVW